MKTAQILRCAPRGATKLQKALFVGVWKSINYDPSDEQWAFHLDQSLLKQAAGGVGGGKSYSSALESCKYLGIVGGLMWIIGPQYELANPEFDYMIRWLRDLNLVDEATVGEAASGARRFSLKAEVGGFHVETKSANKLEGIAAKRPNFILMTEAAQSPVAVFWKAIERATENDAPVVFSGTFETSSIWYAQMYQKWQGPNEEGGKSFAIPTWSNKSKYPGGRNDPKILRAEALMPPALFMERYGGVPTKPSGLVFKEYERKLHVKPLGELFNPALPVEIWCDPATHCYPCLFVQVQEDEKTVHVLDELYPKGVLGQQVIRQVVETRWWRHSCVKGVMDVAGTRRAGANESQLVVWETELRALGEHPITWTYRELRNVQVWYDAIHLRLWNDDERKPLVFFASHLDDTINEDGNANGILGEMLTHRWPREGEYTATPNRPLKKNEDALSALGYGFVCRFGVVDDKKKRLVEVKQTLSPYYGMVSPLQTQNVGMLRMR